MVWDRGGSKQELCDYAPDYWQRACTCASRRVVPWLGRVDQCGCSYDSLLGEDGRAFTRVEVPRSRENPQGWDMVETGEEHAVLDVAGSPSPRCGVFRPACGVASAMSRSMAMALG